MSEIFCVNCGEEENLDGYQDSSGLNKSIVVTCGRCGLTWTRDLTPRCKTCSSDEVRTAVRSIVDKARGTQLSIQSLSVVYLCPKCDVDELAIWNQSNTPLPPLELPYDVE